MYRANLYLHPHTHHSKTSTVPGAYPSSVPKGHGNTDFTRNIQLTVGRSTAQIGRSSRNEAKGLFAARNNGFFESPVMSRAHAEVRMVLEPHRKIVIQDTKSMHGTFVNGLQLHPNETAELQEGTEVTFGAEVTRGDEVYPAKTFRCEVMWERLRSPSPRPEPEAKSRNGYGVSSQVLEYADDDDEEEFDDEMDEHSDAESSGASSSRSAARSPSREKSDSATEMSSYSRGGGDIPESHERSTKDSHSHLKAFDFRMPQFRGRIDREIEAAERRFAQDTNDVPRQRMSSIHNLVNKTQTDDAEKSFKTFKVVDLVYDEEEDDEDPELTIIDKPADFGSRPRMENTNSQASRPSSSQVIIDLVDMSNQTPQPSSGPVMVDLVDVNNQAPKPSSGPVIVDLVDMDQDDDESDEDDEDNDYLVDADSDADDFDSAGEEEDKTMEDEVEESMPEPPKAPEEKAGPMAEKPAHSEPSSPPDVMSSKVPNIWPGSERMGSFIPVRETTALLPPIGRPNSIIAQQQPQNVLPSGPTPRWVPNNQSIDSKREFFESRAKNFARLSALSGDGPDQGITYPAPPAQWSDADVSFTRSTPNWFFKPPHGASMIPISVPVPKLSDAIPKQPDAIQEPNFAPRSFLPRKAPIVTVEKKEEPKLEEKKVEEVVPNPPVVSVEDADCDQDGEYDEEVDYEVNDYYCDLESENDDEGMEELDADMFEPEPINLSSNAVSDCSSAIKTGYSKFSIDDMMNHESPKGTFDAAPAVVLASPPPSEGFEDLPDPPEKKTVPPALEDILNPTAASTPTLKRKRSFDDSPATLPDAPEVVNDVVPDYPELVVEQEKEMEKGNEVEVEVEERPAKRVKAEKRGGGTSFAGLAAAAVAGAVMGGVGMFAALVASAQ